MKNWKKQITGITRKKICKISSRFFWRASGTICSIMQFHPGLDRRREKNPIFTGFCPGDSILQWLVFLFCLQTYRSTNACSGSAHFKSRDRLSWEQWIMRKWIISVDVVEGEFNIIFFFLICAMVQWYLRPIAFKRIYYVNIFDGFLGHYHNCIWFYSVFTVIPTQKFL